MKKLVVANWKMNPGSVKEVEELIKGIEKEAKKWKGADAVVCPPFPYIFLCKKKGIALGAQDCSSQEYGAHTGQVSAKMLKDLGCLYVIVGHSERRRELGETPETVAEKARTAIAAGLIPIICVGEERKGEGMQEQLQRKLSEVSGNFVVAYEPEWAISSNQGSAPASPEDCARAVSLIRSIAGEVLVLYGGSVDGANAASFTREGKADGVLVGSASLDLKRFGDILRLAGE